MVSTRDSTFTGSTFRAAVLRLQGTLMGSMFSFFLLILALGNREGLEVRLRWDEGRGSFPSVFSGCHRPDAAPPRA